jgi:hypothetical protein
MDIFSGSYKIFASGIVIQYNNEPIRFSIAPNMSLVFKFITTEDKNIRMEHTISNDSLIVLLYNFDNSLGTGNTIPINIGVLNNRKFYINFRVYALSELKESRTLHYTLYLGEEVKNAKPV